MVLTHSMYLKFLLLMNNSPMYSCYFPLVLAYIMLHQCTASFLFLSDYPLSFPLSLWFFIFFFSRLLLPPFTSKTASYAPEMIFIASSVITRVAVQSILSILARSLSKIHGLLRTGALDWFKLLTRDASSSRSSRIFTGPGFL